MITTDVIPLIINPTLEYYNHQAQALLAACRSVDNDTIRHVAQYHPSPEKFTDINNPTTNFTIDDARLIVAREHGFEDIATFETHILELSRPGSGVDAFERAADAVAGGNAEVLRDLLQQYPQLTGMKSTRAHEATLLHYVSANGVENYRQRTPDNAVEIADMLLRAGCEPDAGARVYAGNWVTTLDLLVSSCHPDKKNIKSGLLEKLLDFGAAVDGVRGDGSPLVTSICFYYPEIVRTLLRRGASVNNIPVAAAVGRLDFIAQYLDGSGKLIEGAPLINVPWLKMKHTPEANLELAFVWAAMFDQQEVVAAMLKAGVSLTSRDHRQWSALHWAAYYGHSGMVSLLLAAKAPLEARNEFGGTVLDQTLWATSHEELRVNHPEIVQRLLQAGAKIHSWWLFDTLTPPLAEPISGLLKHYEKQFV